MVLPADQNFVLSAIDTVSIWVNDALNLPVNKQQHPPIMNSVDDQMVHAEAIPQPVVASSQFIR